MVVGIGIAVHLNLFIVCSALAAATITTRRSSIALPEALRTLLRFALALLLGALALGHGIAAYQLAVEPETAGAIASTTFIVVNAAKVIGANLCLGLLLLSRRYVVLKVDPAPRG